MDDEEASGTGTEAWSPLVDGSGAAAKKSPFLQKRKSFFLSDSFPLED